MLAKMQRAVDHVFIRSDEKIFTVEAVINTQKDKPYALDLPEGGRIHLRPMKQTEVIVWAAVAFDGFKSLLVFIVEGLKINTQVYI